MAVAGPAGRGRVGPRGARGQRDDLGDHRPGPSGRGRGRRHLPPGAGRVHQGRHPPRGPGSSACAPGTSPRRPAWPPDCPTAPRSPSARLRAVDAAEAALRALGFGQLRVRHHGTVARLEVEPEDLARRAGPPPRGRGRRAVGRFRFVALDLEGFRSGSMNRMLERPPWTGRRGDRGEGTREPGPGEADLSRVAGAPTPSWPRWSASSTWSPTSAGPTSRSTGGGSSASSTATPSGSRPPSSGCARRASRSTCWATCWRAERRPRG